MLITKLNLFSPLPPSECLERVAAITDQWWLAPGSDPVIGKVGHDWFRWHMRPSHRNPPGPILHVRLIAKETGSQVTGWFRPGIGQIILHLIIIPFFGLNAFVVLLNWHSLWDASLWQQFRSGLIVLVACGLPIFVIRDWRKKKMELTMLLRRTLRIEMPPCAVDASE